MRLSFRRLAALTSTPHRGCGSRVRSGSVCRNGHTSTGNPGTGTNDEPGGSPVAQSLTPAAAHRESRPGNDLSDH